MRVIDVSEHQGVIDWRKVKADGVEGVIIRAGYGKGNVDGQFKKNIQGVLDAGFEYVGLYWFSYAYTEDMAKREAQFLNDVAIDYKSKLNLGVYFDWEYDSMNYARKRGAYPNRQLITDMNKAFCDKVTELGYIAGYYTNWDYSQSYIDTSRLTTYRKWYALYQSKKDSDCYLWQYSSTGHVNGIVGNVDLNELVGAVAPENKPKPNDKRKSNQEIAKEVIEGKWGNGYERKSRLKKAGYDYEAVQNIVNQMLNSSTKELYTIKPGDTLWDIAQKYGTTVGKIAAENNIKNPDKIYAGQKIYV